MPMSDRVAGSRDETSGWSLGRVCAAGLVTCAGVPYRFEARLGPFASFSVLDLAFLSCLVVVGATVVRRGYLTVGRRAVLVALGIPAVLAICSTLWTVDLTMSAKAVIVYTYAFLLYLVVVNLLQGASPQFVGRLVVWFAMIVLGGALAFYLGVPGFALFALGDAEFDAHRMVSAYARLSHPFIGLSNDFAPVLAFTFFIVAGLTRFARSRWYKGLAVLLSLSVMLTFSRGVVGGLIVVGLLLWAHARFGLQLAAKAALVILVVSVALYTFASRYTLSGGGRELSGREILVSRLSDPTTIESRIASYQATLALVWQRPALGYGAGVFDPADHGELAGTSHSTYLEQLLFYGLVLGALSCLAWFALAYVFWDWPSRDVVAVGFARTVSAAVVVTLLGAASQTFMEATAPRLLIHLLVGMSVALLSALGDGPRPRAA